MVTSRQTDRDRRSCACLLRSAGWSLRRIGEELDVGFAQVYRDVRHIRGPERVIGSDGKSYPARRAR